MPDDECERRLGAIEVQLHDHLQEAKETFDEIRKDIACMARTMAKYEPYLKESLEKRRRTDNLQRAIVEKSLTAAVWAIVIFFAYAVWEYIKKAINNVA